jgi:hypothetical protein
MKNTYLTSKALTMGTALSLTLGLGFTSLNAHASNACLVSQNVAVNQMKLVSGTVAQTFKPCQNGTLDYITLHLNSANAKSFTAELLLKQGKEIIASQQIVIAGQGTNANTTTWLATPPAIEEGKEYRFEIAIPEGQELEVGYTGDDLYSSGRMSINGMLLNGDIAFEAGIRSFDRNENITHRAAEIDCIPVQEIADRVVSPRDFIGQTFESCENLRLIAASVGYRTSHEVKGNVAIYKIAQQNAILVGTLKFTASPADEVGTLMATTDNALDIQAGGIYQLRVVPFEGERFPSDFMLWYGVNNPYDRGTMFTRRNGATNNDLNFELFEVRGLASESDDNSAEFELFADFPEHECIASQPYFNHEHAFNGVSLSLEVPVCEDGKLEAVYLPGTIDGDGAVTYVLRDDRGRNVRTGSIQTIADGVLLANLENAPALYYYKYTLDINVPAGTNLRIPSSDSPDHGAMKVNVNGSPYERNLAYAVGMKPYVFNFDEAIEEREIQVNVFPNPFVSDFNLQIDGLDGREATVRVYNFQGTEVFTTQVEARDESTTVHVVPEHALTRGYYTIRIEYGDSVKIETVVKQ